MLLFYAVFFRIILSVSDYIGIIAEFSPFHSDSQKKVFFFPFLTPTLARFTDILVSFKEQFRSHTKTLNISKNIIKNISKKSKIFIEDELSGHSLYYSPCDEWRF